MAVAADNHLTIEQVAGESGTSMRNIRAHQARELAGRWRTM